MAADPRAKNSRSIAASGFSFRTRRIARIEQARGVFNAAHPSGMKIAGQVMAKTAEALIMRYPFQLDPEFVAQLWQRLKRILSNRNAADEICGSLLPSPEQLTDLVQISFWA